MVAYCSNKIHENVFDFMPLTFFVEADFKVQKQYSKEMLDFINAFYALDDVKKRARRLFSRMDGVDEQKTEEDDKADLVVDDNYIFKHFYQNRLQSIKQHKKEEREEKEAIHEANFTPSKLKALLAQLLSVDLSKDLEPETKEAL